MSIRHALLSLFLVLAAPAAAQELEPRAFSQVPVGMNFAILSWGYAGGDVIFDSSVPIEDATGNIQTITAGYVRSLGLWGKSAKLAVLVPYSAGDWEGQLDGSHAATSRTGFRDPAVQLSVNLIGGPALRMRDLALTTERTVAGISVLATAPLGRYDPSKLINLGAGRWMVRPRLGVSHSTGRWTVEFMGSVRLYQDNGDFYGGSTLAQDPLWSATADVLYRFRRGFWLGLGGALVTGGRTIVDGDAKNTYQKNHRLGAILAYPLNTQHSLKLLYVAGLRTTVGSDFDTVSLAWQMRWGGMD